MHIFIRCKDYDKIKKDEAVKLVVEAKNREPMEVYVKSTAFSNDKIDYGNYENARFNGEFD